MKQLRVCVILIVMFSLNVFAQQPKTDQAKPKQKAKSSTFKTIEEKMSYLSGFDFGFKVINNCKATKFPLDNSAFIAGLKEGLNEKENQFSPEEIQQIVDAFQKVHPQGNDPKKQQEAAVKNKKEGEEFLAANGKKDSVKTTPSGLQYKILREGTGISPVDTSDVTVHYRGRVINGTVFDESYKRGEPATFRLNQVIRGWTEGVKLMKEGAKFEFYIPSSLAYGDQQAGELIPPGSTLIFEVELLSVK